jgi:hypothetical protein
MSFYLDTIDTDDGKNEPADKSSRTNETVREERLDKVGGLFNVNFANNKSSKAGILKPASKDTDDEPIPVDYEDENAIADTVKAKPGATPSNQQRIHFSSASSVLSARESQKLSARMTSYVKENNPKLSVEESVLRNLIICFIIERCFVNLEIIIWLFIFFLKLISAAYETVFWQKLGQRRL